MNMQVQQQDTSLLLPPGRIVQGDLYEAQTKDMQGNDLVVKSGDRKGEKRVQYFFAVAIPKAGEQAWWLTAWGAKILSLAQAWWPQGQTGLPTFAWKVGDGDDQRPNPEANMRRNCDREGFPGHWVVRLGSGFATKVFDESGTPLLQADLVKRGYWVEVHANLQSNNNAQKPGIYINHSMVFYRAPGKEIVSGPDPRSVGAGRAALPPGVTAVPVGNIANVPNPAGMPGMSQMPTMMVPPGGASFPQGAYAPPSMPQMPAPGGYPAMPGAPAPAPQMPAAMPVAPHAGFIAPPGGGMPAIPQAPTMPMQSAPPPPAAAPSVVCQLGAPMGYKMVNLNGPNYASYRAQNWQDAQLLQHGLMVRL